MSFHPYPSSHWDSIITRALQEDQAAHDITSQALIPGGKETRFRLLVKQMAILAGMDLLVRCCAVLDEAIVVSQEACDGEQIMPMTVIAHGSGPLRSVLAVERTALNFLQHASGIATVTRAYVEAVEGTGATILDTRKTIPGLRDLAKYAVRCGGGQNHRHDLASMVLIKDNHLASGLSITEAIEQARKAVPAGMVIEVECDHLSQVQEALQARPDRIMLDNMSLDQLREAVQMVQKRIPLEASGGVSLENVRAIAETGVDYISVGRLTHSAPAVDISWEIGEAS